MRQQQRERADQPLRGRKGLSLFGTAACAAISGLTVIGAAGQAKAEPIIALVTTPSIVNALVTFDSATPGATSALIPITGTSLFETIVGIDIRPTTGELFGVGSGNNLYTINPTTGVATLRAPLTGATLGGTFFGVDFNPVPDLAGNPSFRVISDTGQNLRINANTGQVLVDTMITGGTIVSSAYINNDVDPATGTTLYGIDPNTDTLLRSTNANMGTYVTVGALGLDVSGLSGFDVSGSGFAFAAFTGPNFTLTGPSTFHTIDLATGLASGGATIGATSAGFSIRGIAALPNQTVPEPGTLALLGTGAVGGFAGLVRRRRSGKTANAA